MLKDVTRRSGSLSLTLFVLQHVVVTLFDNQTLITSAVSAEHQQTKTLHAVQSGHT